MKHTTKLFLAVIAMIAGTLLLMAGAGGTGPRYVGRFFGDGTGLSNSVDLVEGPNILITPGPGNRAYTIESTAAGAAGIFTNGIMGYGDQYRTNYVRINSTGVTVTGGSLVADRLVVLDGALSNYIAGDITMAGSMAVDGITASGTIFTSDVFEGNGVSLTNLNGDEIRSGTVADARIASTIARDSEVTTATQNATNAGNIAFLPANNLFTGNTNTYSGYVIASNIIGGIIRSRTNYVDRVQANTSSTLDLVGGDGSTIVLGNDAATFSGGSGGFVGLGSGLTFDASAFNGNLTPTDNTVQELAQAVDDLVLGSGVSGFFTNGGVVSFRGTNNVETYQVGGDSVAVGYGNNGGAPHNILFSDSSDTGTELRDPHETNAVLRLDTDGTISVTKGTFTTTGAANVGTLVATGVVSAASFTGSGVGVTNLQVQTALNVLNYGATTNDDNSDDTAAFQAALNALDPLGGGVVFTPRGYYFLTQITMNKGATLAGEGTADGKGTQINQLAAAGDVPMIIISNAPGATIRDLMLQGVNTSGVGAKPGIGVSIRDQSMHARLANLKIWFFKTGIHMTNTWTHTIDNVWCSVNGDGIDTDGIVNAVNVRGGDYSNNTNGIHLDLTSSGSWMISGTTIEGNIGKGVWVETLRGPLSISDCYFELNGDFDIHSDCDITDVPDSAKLSIENNFFNDTPTNIFLSQIPNTIIEGSRVVAAGSTVFVSADAVCTNIALPHNVGDAALTIYAPTAGRIEFYNGTNRVNSLVSDRLAYGSMWAQGGSGMTNNAQNMRATNYFASDSDGVGVNLVVGYITNWLAGTYKLTATVGGLAVGSAGPAVFSFRTNDVSTLRTFCGYIDLDRGASGHAVVVAPANTRFSLHVDVTPSMTLTTNYEFTIERLK